MEREQAKSQGNNQPERSEHMMNSSILTALPLLALAACSAGGSATLAPTGSTLARIHEQRPAQPLVYISQQADNSISVFHLDGKRIDRITQSVNYPQGLFADASGTLYVANRGAHNVLEFKRGATSPFKSLSDDKEEPEGVTLCPDGTVYVANILGPHGGGGDITVYGHGSTHPTGTLNYTGAFFFFLACDAHGNLFGSMVLGSTGTVVEFPGAQQSDATLLPISWGGNPAGIAIDKSGNLLAAGQGEGVEEFTESGTPTGLQIATGGVNEISLNANGTLLLGSTSKGAVQYTLPGGVLDHTYHVSRGTPIGAAFDPGAN
jgi:DNA-binding beta-propeller fold protein YncE